MLREIGRAIWVSITLFSLSHFLYLAVDPRGKADENESGPDFLVRVRDDVHRLW